MCADEEPKTRPAGPDGAPPAGSPHHVRFPVNLHRWDLITFLHWPVDPAVLARLLPDGLRPLTWEGSAWVGVTPFRIGVRLPVTPAVPWLTVFPETNVRTYVAGPGGREGLWFLHMEVTRTWFVATLRAVGLPYVPRRMTVARDDDGRLTYTSHVRRSGERSHRVVVRPGAPLDPPPGGPRERFLTARWGAFHRRAGALLFTRADHPPWPLHTATVEECDVAPLFEMAKLPAPTDPPLAHFSPGVPVRISRPELVSGAASSD